MTNKDTMEKMAQWVVEVIGVYREALFAASEEILQDVKASLEGMIEQTLTEIKEQEDA